MERQSGDPTMTVSPDHREHDDVGGICGVCGEWLPVAYCRDASCTWTGASGEQTLDDAVLHHQRTAHRVRVVIN